MKSPFAEWLDDLQHEADKENAIVYGRHYDILIHLFEQGKNVKDAFVEYNKFTQRWNAITQSGKFTK